MKGRTNGILDGGFNMPSFDRPETRIEADDEKRQAILARSKEWKQIVDYLESRKEFYRHHLPGGIDLNLVNPQNYTDFVVLEKTAHNIIQEFDALINSIEVTADAFRGN
jgi:hypothetical protein